MSYNDLTTTKKINGLPADIRYYEQLNQNDSYFKTIVDEDEDMAALNRDIIPAIHNLYDIGSSTSRFNEVFAHNLISNLLTLSSGTAINPALTIGLSSLTSLAPNQLSFIASGLESIRMMTSGLLVRAANSTQLKIENTLPTSLAQWSIGADETGLIFTDISNSNQSLKISSDSISVPSRVLVSSGSELAPSFSFSGDHTTGFYKSLSSPKVNFSVSGVDTLSLDTNGLNLLMGKLSIPSGSASEPGLTFNGFANIGLSGLDSRTLGFIIDGEPVHTFNNEGYSSEIEGASFSAKRVFSETGLANWHTDLIGRANGSKSIPLPLMADEEVYAQSIEAYTDAGWQKISGITVSTSEDYDNGSYGSSMIFSVIRNGENEPTEALMLSSPENASVHVPMSIGLGKAELNTAGLDQEIDVSNISKLLVDTTSGNIEVKGFVGGKEGQMLYIYKKVTTNSFTLVFNSGTASQKVLLKGSTNFVNTNDYGGITLSYDDGIWREVSRS